MASFKTHLPDANCFQRDLSTQAPGLHFPARAKMLPQGAGYRASCGFTRRISTQHALSEGKFSCFQNMCLFSFSVCLSEGETELNGFNSVKA